MPPRSLIQLDVKSLGAPLHRRGRPFLARLRRRAHRLHLISIGVVAAAAVYLLTIAPLDSTATETVAAAEFVAAEVTTAAAPAGNAETVVAAPAENTETVVAAAPSPAEAAILLASVAHAPPAVPTAGAVFETEIPPAVAPDTRPAADARPPPQFEWTPATVKKRDTLSQLFKRHGVRVADAYAVAALDGAHRLRTIRPGQTLELAAGAGGELLALRYRIDPLTTLRIDRAGDRGDDGADAGQAAFTAATVTRAPDIQLRAGRGVINSSLLAAAKRAGLDFATTYAFAQLFDWQVDFAREIRAGDQFSLIFEAHYLDGEKIGNGDIVAAELVVSGRRLQAVRHIDEHGARAHYAPNGDGIQRSFLRSPVEFGRVTSNFSHKRFHPILKKWRPHRGVDYGAPTGTPVRATGDGVVTSARRRYGYGKTVIIRHGEKYTTLYAHLHAYAKGVKAGARIKQGEVIGAVGATGWATGPHLHYEFRVGGVHQNPLTVELPKSDPIAARYRDAFVAEAARWMARLQRGDFDPGSVAQLDAP